jgi:Flagellar hook-length control protein FliK
MRVGVAPAGEPPAASPQTTTVTAQAAAAQDGKNPPPSSVHRPGIAAEVEGKLAAAAAGAAASEVIDDMVHIDGRLSRSAGMVVEPDMQDSGGDAALPVRAALAWVRERVLPPTLEQRLLVALTGSQVSLSPPQQNPQPASMRTAEAMTNQTDAAPDSPSSAPAKPPVPPYRGGPMTAQPPAAASITVDAEPRAIAERLLADTDAALARHTLLQAASLPDGGDAGRADRTDARWTFDIPFAAPHGTAIAQFEIARDGRRASSGEDSGPAWRARFSLDVEPMGPVHVHIALTQGRAAVTLWAEREASAARLREDAPLLAQALREAELEPGDVLVRTGEPPRPAAAATGHFLDRAS